MPSPTPIKVIFTLLCIISRVIANPIDIHNPQLLPRIITADDSSSDSHSPKFDIILHVAIAICIFLVVAGILAWLQRARKRRARQQTRLTPSVKQFAYKPPPYTGVARTMNRTDEYVPLPPYEAQPARGHTVLQGGVAEPAPAHLVGDAVR